jgi:prepilin-type processing-associated H-X9-DG protein
LGGEWLKDPLSGGWNSVPSSLRRIRENEILHPSEMLAIGDSHVSWYLDPGPILGDSDLSDLINYHLVDSGGYAWYASRVKRRHNSRWNMLFCDGHVQMLRVEQLADPQNDNVRRLWNKDHESHWEFPGNR